jgi:hypothetical protein
MGIAGCKRLDVEEQRAAQSLGPPAVRAHLYRRVDAGPKQGGGEPWVKAKGRQKGASRTLDCPRSRRELPYPNM